MLARVALAMIVIAAAARCDAQATPASSTASPQPAPANHFVTYGQDGFKFTTPNGANSISVSGYIQGDARIFWRERNGQAVDTLLFRRIRPTFQIRIFRDVQFRFMPDFGQNDVVLQDAYVELKTPHSTRMRIGKFKSPLGLETLRQDRESSFVERSLTSNLVPVRDLGVEFAGSLRGKSVQYAVGYFNGAPDGSNAKFDWNNRYDVEARVFMVPWTARTGGRWRNLGFGAAVSAGQNHGKMPSLKTVGQHSLFQYLPGTSADGLRTRFVPQAYLYSGPFGVLAEYVVWSQRAGRNASTKTLVDRAWQVAGSVVLTGDENSYDGVRPKRTKENSRGFRYWGAWELTARISHLAIDKTCFGVFASPDNNVRSALELAVGANWYIQAHLKLITTYEHTGFAPALASASAPIPEKLVMARLQFGF